jgi:hypothetical protein
MSQACCAKQKFERHLNPKIADIGHGGGAEYTVGNCQNCRAILIHCWVAGGASEGVEVVTKDLIDSFLAAQDPKTKTKLLRDWFEGLP